MTKRANIDAEPPSGIQLPIQDLGVQGEFEITSERQKKVREGTGRIGGAHEPDSGPAIGTKVGATAIYNDYSRRTYHLPIVYPEQIRRGARVDPGDI
jgi:hypothetical protein